MNFVLNRDQVLYSTMGHTIRFEKGVPAHVPPELWGAAQAIGAVPESDLPQETKAASTEPADPIARKKMIMDAFEKLVLANERESFAGTGAPHVKAIMAIIGFHIDARERDALWLEFKTADQD